LAAAPPRKGSRSRAARADLSATPRGGEGLHFAIWMSRAKRPMRHHVTPRRRSPLFVHVSREGPDVTPCRASPLTGSRGGLPSGPRPRSWQETLSESAAATGRGAKAASRRQESGGSHALPGSRSKHPEPRGVRTADPSCFFRGAKFFGTMGFLLHVLFTSRRPQKRPEIGRQKGPKEVRFIRKSQFGTVVLFHC
jgi:hypothetical protein